MRRPSNSNEQPSKILEGGEVNERTGGEDISLIMIQMPARSISDVPSDGSWIHESVHLIRSPTRVHDFPFLTVMTSQCLPKARRMFDFVSSWVTRLRVCSFATSGSGITPVSRRMSKVFVTWRRAQEGRHLLIDKVAFKVVDHSSAARLYRRPCEDRQRTYQRGYLNTFAIKHSPPDRKPKLHRTDAPFVAKPPGWLLDAI